MTCVGVLCACPLPDFGIQVITEDLNNAPVRLIEPVGLSPAQDCECEPSECPEGEDPNSFTAACPLPDVIGLPHFLDPADPLYQYCRCAEGLDDQGALFAVEFFAEDQDKEPDSTQPKDTLFAAILLNADPEDRPEDQVAYAARYRSPTDPLPVVVGGGYSPPGRPTPFVRRIFVGDSDLRWDLCNDPLARQGFNTLTILVTDRPWNEVTLPAAGNMEETTVPEVGVVDVANGATFDTKTYTFYCSSTNDPGNPVSPGGEGNDPFKCVDRCKEPGE